MKPSFTTSLRTFVSEEKKRNEAYVPGLKTGVALKYNCVYPKMAELASLDVECIISAKKESCLCNKHAKTIIELKCSYPGCTNLKKPEDQYCDVAKECLIKLCPNMTHGNIFCDGHTCHNEKCKKFNNTGNRFCNDCKCGKCDLKPRKTGSSFCSYNVCKNCKKCTNESPICKECRCSAYNCNNCIEPNSKRCKKHICQDCGKDLSKYGEHTQYHCKKCKCKVNDCYKNISKSDNQLIQKLKLCDDHVKIQKKED